MTQSPNVDNQTTLHSPTSTSSAAILLLLTILDTTWRAFLPTIGGTVSGIMLDHTFNTVPLLTVIMILIGSAISTLLIILQVRKIRRQR